MSIQQVLQLPWRLRSRVTVDAAAEAATVHALVVTFYPQPRSHVADWLPDCQDSALLHLFCTTRPVQESHFTDIRWSSSRHWPQLTAKEVLDLLRRGHTGREEGDGCLASGAS